MTCPATLSFAKQTDGGQKAEKDALTQGARRATEPGEPPPYHRTSLPSPLLAGVENNESSVQEL